MHFLLYLSIHDGVDDVIIIVLFIYIYIYIFECY